MGKNESCNIELVDIDKIKPIENFCPHRVEKVKDDILKNNWIHPVVLFFNKKDNLYHVLDGHHRSEIAKLLCLKKIPAIIIEDYFQVKIRSLRDEIKISHKKVIDRSINGNIYPYKTVKHDFDFELPELNIKISDLD